MHVQGGRGESHGCQEGESGNCLSSNAGRGEGGGTGVLRKGCTGQVLNSPFPRWAHRQSEGSRAGEAGVC